MTTWTTRQVADMAGVTDDTVRNEIARGNLTAIRTGKIRLFWRVDPADARRWAAQYRRGVHPAA